MNGLLVQLSEKELSILLSALNYLSTKDEKQLQIQYGSIVRLYDKLKKQHETVIATEDCACKPTTEKINE